MSNAHILIDFSMTSDDNACVQCVFACSAYITLSTRFYCLLTEYTLAIVARQCINTLLHMA